MADLSITVADVLKGDGATIATGTAGATVTAGQTIYKDLGDDSKLKPADADALATAACEGISLHGALTGQPLTYITGNNVDVGATLAVGEVYVVSVTPGGIAPETDLATGDFPTILGIATTSSNINLSIQQGGVEKD